MKQDEAWATRPDTHHHKVQRNTVGELYEIIGWCWVALALTSLILQASWGVDISLMHVANSQHW